MLTTFWQLNVCYLLRLIIISLDGAFKLSINVHTQNIKTQNFC